ncbi:MAG TPA: Mur ligase domain-containing protein [Pyrinomonadaceae bacterium]|nr:Mur ligase domain-containing protein [Pyrinomonadaceae bacterium]
MVGIGGIGMSALAQLLKHQGKKVSGSDREESPTTALLHEKGIEVQIGHRAENIPEETELIVYSDAVPADSAERIGARERGIRQVSYFELLGTVSKESRDIAVAGTHGKTTTTGMIAKILSDAGEKPTAIIGSIVRDFSSNFLAGNNELFVIEACEYRDHLLELSPEILVITNIELDHTDFFPSLSALQSTFRAAVEKVPEHGAIIANPNDPNVAAVLKGAKARVIDYTQKAVGSLQLVGEFNRDNARAALAAALAAVPKLSPEAAVHSLSEFKGSWRRFEFKGETPQGALVYDDYAHHPTAVAKTIAAAREKFPDKKIVVAFHPHLFSRTKSFLKEFSDALATADKAIVAPIYAAREKDDGSISHHSLAASKKNVAALDSFDEIRDALLEEKEGALIITMGAGDIYKVAEQITEQ